jgi:hypothetical protein
VKRPRSATARTVKSMVGVALSLEFRRVDQEAIAPYCLLLNSNAIGGAEKREPTLISHISSSVVSSKAATVPSSKATSATRWRLADED